MSLNQNGQILTLLNITLPLLLALLSTLYLSGQFLKQRAIYLSDCRSGQHSIQQGLLTSLKSLQALNGQAKHLRFQAHRLKAAAASGQAAALTALATVKAQQLKLRLQQNKILSEARARASAALKDILFKLKRTHPKSNKVSLKLHVVPHPVTSLSPSYYPAPGFSRLQNLKITWQELLMPVRVESLQKTLKLNARLSIPNSCSSTIRKKGPQWTAYLE